MLGIFFFFLLETTGFTIMSYAKEKKNHVFFLTKGETFVTK